MRSDGRGRTLIIIAVSILLLTIILLVPARSDTPGNFICIGECNSTIIPIAENQPPVFDSIANQNILEESLLTFSLNASDPENDIIYYMVTIPLGSSLVPNGKNYTFVWTPTYSQAGSYVANFSVTDAGGLTDYQNITITVINVNRPPEFTNPGDKSISENGILTFTLSATDPDGDPVTYGNVGSLPDGALLNSSTGDFSWKPTYGQSGTYTINFSARDTAGLKDYTLTKISVTNVNRPPELSFPGDRTIPENSTLTFNLFATDPDGDSLTYGNETALPKGSTLNKNSGVFSWKPDFTQAGNYSITFSASDQIDTAFTSMKITVTNVNRPPELTNLGDKTVSENSTIAFTLVATDPDGDVVIYGNVTILPLGASLDQSTGAFTWKPSYEQSGTYLMNFSARDPAGLKDYASMKITVSNLNRPPILTNPGNKTVDENAKLNFTLSATDPDEDSLVFSTIGSLPAGAVLNASTGRFEWTPSYAQNGTYQVNFSVSDSSLQDIENITIIVIDKHVAPILDLIGNKTAEEGLVLNFAINATDPDKDDLTYNVSSLPSRSTFNTSTRTFSWIPAYNQKGTYYLNFTVIDAVGLMDYENVTINVIDPIPSHASTTNYAPVFDPVFDLIGQAANVSNMVTGPATYSISFRIGASDFNGDTLVYDAIFLPEGATFNPTTKIFSWTPEYGITGLYVAKFRVSDGTLTDSSVISITVTAPPQPSKDCERL